MNSFQLDLRDNLNPQVGDKFTRIGDFSWKK